MTREVKMTKMTKMTEKQKETFDRLTRMVADIFTDAELVSIRGALRLAMKDWEESSGMTVSEAEKWPFEKYLNDCCRPALTNFAERLINQGYDRDTAMHSLKH